MRRFKISIIFICAAALSFYFGCKSKTNPNENPNKERKSISLNLIKPIVDSGVQHMVFPFPQGHLPASSYFTSNERDSLIRNYWKDEGEKSYSLITLADLTELFDESTGKDKVLIKVSKIEDLVKVKIEWIAYDSALLQKEEEEQIHYFIFKRENYDDRHEDTHDENTPPMGVKFAREVDKDTKAITARLAKNGDKYHIILNSTFVYFLNKNNSGGASHGTDAGIKIPPPQQ